MGLEKVVEDILRRGEERRREILRLGEQERDEQVRAAEQRAAEERAKAEKRAEAMIAQMEQQELSSAELDSKRAILAAQRQVMEDLRAQVLSELRAMPPERRKSIYSKLMAKARAELGECIVYSNESDRRLLQLPPGMSNGGTIECAGGLVFESKDGSIRLDYRFESLLEDVWNRKMQEIYAKLFR